MDGKDLRGASKQTGEGRRVMAAAVEHETGLVLGQVEADSRSNEIPAVRELSRSLDLAGPHRHRRCPHARHETMRCLRGQGADCVVAIKDNQQTILEDLRAVDFADAPSHETVDKGHGRIERRRCAVADLSGPGGRAPSDTRARAWPNPPSSGVERPDGAEGSHAGLVFCPLGEAEDEMMGVWPFRFRCVRMAVMDRIGAQDPIDVRAVTVRPTLGAREHRRWDRLVEEHHYLEFRGVIGKGLRHVAVHGERWVALIGWQPGAFKLGARDRWIGWTAAQQFERLHLIANNSRFVILGAEGVRNLASRVLGLSLRRLCADIEAVHGYPVLVAETFVDVSRFAGTCYRASNWVRLGRTRGFSRAPGGPARWREHGRPKEVYVYEMDGGASALRGVELPDDWRADGAGEAPATSELRSLHAFLDDMPDFRKPRGRRYGLACHAAIMIAARLAGYRGVAAFGEFAARLDQEQLRAAGAFFSPSRRCWTARMCAAPRGGQGTGASCWLPPSSTATGWCSAKCGWARRPTRCRQRAN